VQSFGPVVGRNRHYFVRAANGVNNQVFSLAVASSELYVGGSFGSAGGQVSSNIASYTPEVIFSNGFE